MNTQEEIDQTFRDYRDGKNGFEKALKWRSDYLSTRRLNFSRHVLNFSSSSLSWNFESSIDTNKNKMNLVFIKLRKLLPI